LRLSECLNLGVKDIDFDLKEIVVRKCKGGNDRRTLLPVSLVPKLKMYRDRDRLRLEENMFL
jgi:integrase